MKQTVAMGIALLFTLGALAQTAPAGPPPFITFPILTRVAEPGLVNGHFVFGGEAAVPAPLFRDPGSAAVNPAAIGTGAVNNGVDVGISISDSYEGETGAAATATLLVGGSNHIYPGNCNAAAATGTFGDCAPLAYSSTGGSTFSHTALPRTWNGTTFGIGFDPGVDFDKNGTFYFTYGVAPLGSNFPNAVVAVKSSNGVNWTQLTPVTFNKSRNFDDKYYLAVDRSNSAFANHIYVSWDRNQGNNQILLIASSSNGGASWTAPVRSTTALPSSSVS
jgi:hypothetical protein